MTGRVDEQCLFACHGTGANGKSTLLAILHYILGDYAVNLPFTALELNGRSSISNDVAMLAGRRFATAIETGESVKLNEARIKAITGGDPITARRLYHENVTFNPTHKLWLAFNHKPCIADESEGMCD
jgi:putative DNA primase/helicase